MVTTQLGFWKPCLRESVWGECGLVHMCVCAHGLMEERGVCVHVYHHRNTVGLGGADGDPQSPLGAHRPRMLESLPPPQDVRFYAG